MMVSLKKEDLIGIYRNLSLDKCELQITSFLAHVWNEIEHDTIYKKGKDTNLSENEISAIDSLGLLTKTGDNIINTLLTARGVREADEQVSFESEQNRIYKLNELKNFLESHFGEKLNGRLINYNSNIEEFHFCLQRNIFTFTTLFFGYFFCYIYLLNE